MKKIFILVFIAIVNIVASYAQKPGVYKMTRYQVDDKAEEPYPWNVWKIIGMNGKVILLEPYASKNGFTGKSTIRFRFNPDLGHVLVDYNDSAFHNRWTVTDRNTPETPKGSTVTDYYQKVVLPPEVKDFIDCLTIDHTSASNRILGVWYYEISGIKCYKVFAPTRSLVIFAYEKPEGSLVTANCIIGAVNYGRNKVVAEDGTRYTIRWDGDDAMTTTYIVDGKRHQEHWTRSSLPDYFSGLFK